MSEHQVFGPTWIKTVRYDIDATLPEGTSPYQVWETLRTLLKERLKLSVEQQSRVLPVYALTVAKSGVKLRAARDPEAPVAEEPFREGSRDNISMDHASMQKLSAMLSRTTDPCGDR